MKKIIIKRNRKNAQCLKGKTGIYCAIHHRANLTLARGQSIKNYLNRSSRMNYRYATGETSWKGFLLFLCHFSEREGQYEHGNFSPEYKTTTCRNGIAWLAFRPRRPGRAFHLDLDTLSCARGLGRRLRPDTGRRSTGHCGAEWLLFAVVRRK